MLHFLPLVLVALVFYLNSRRNAGRGKAPESRSDSRGADIPWRGDDADTDDEDTVEALFRSAEETVVALTGTGSPDLNDGRADRTATTPRPRIVSSTVPHFSSRQRRVKYLLDGEAGHRPAIDRVARIQRIARGKGLCSPR